MSERERFLRELEARLRLRGKRRADALAEIESHIAAAVEAGEDEGTVVARLGEPQELAQALDRVEGQSLRVVVLAAATLLAVAVSVAIQWSDSRVGGNFSPEQAQAFRLHPVYWTGESALGHRLAAVLRRNDTASYVSFVYGECQARGGMGCAPPLEIQTWPSSRRHLRRDDTSAPRAAKRVVVRGAPAAFAEGGVRLEVYTPDATVVIFGPGRRALLDVARSLRPVNER